MMEKDFVKLNEEELKDVAGGLVDSAVFFSQETRLEAQNYLRSTGVKDIATIDICMEKWEKAKKFA